MPSVFSSPSRQLPPAPGHRRTLSSTLVEESVAAAAALVEKWRPDVVSCSLFLSSSEAQRFLRAAAELHRAMVFFAADSSNPHSQSQSGRGHGLVQAQALLQTAMRRLQRELQFLLDEQEQDRSSTTSTSVIHIRAVAKSMMAAGYGKECVFTYKSHRRTALAAKLQRLLGFSPPAASASAIFQFQKTSWEQIDGKIIPSWLATATVAFGSLFTAEKELCDTVFEFDTVRDAVFASVANDHATSLLGVAEAAVARARRAPERLFRVLDVHDALTHALPPLLSVFNSDVAARAAAVVAKVVEAARATLSGFEAAIHKEPASSKTVAGGAVHPLTRYVMNYLVFLADYHDGLALIYDYDYDYDYDQQQLQAEDSAADHPSPSSPIHRLLSALLGKLEAKAGCYREVALSYLFLANNTKYVASKVAGSGKLRAVLGDEWAAAQSAKARAHVDVYVRAAWGKAIAAMAADRERPAEGVEAAVMAAVAMQDQWVAADQEMGAALTAAATAAVVPKYRIFYRRHGAAVRLTPGDVTTMIAALFGAPAPHQQQQRCTEVAAEPLQRHLHLHLEPPNSHTTAPQQLFTSQADTQQISI